MNARQPRVPAGVSVGGRFTVSSHPEADVTLAAQAGDPRPRRLVDDLDAQSASLRRERGRAAGAARTVSGRNGGARVVVSVRES